MSESNNTDEIVLAVSGSTKCLDRCWVHGKMDDFVASMMKGRLPDRVVHGGAAGVDSLADEWAESRGVARTVFRPEWDRLGRSAGIQRNADIVGACTHFIAFPSPSGAGTQDAIRRALARHVPAAIHWIRPADQPTLPFKPVARTRTKDEQ